MGFLKKIFGGKKKNKNEDAASPQGTTTTTGSSTSKNKNGWRAGKGKDKAPAGTPPPASPNQAGASNGKSRNDRPSGPGTPGDEGMIPRNGSYANTYPGSASSREREMEQQSRNMQTAVDIGNIDPRDMTQEQLRIAYEMSKAAANKNKTSPNAAANTSAKNQNYLYDENLDPTSSAASNSNQNQSGTAAPGSSPRLTSNQLQQWDRHVNDAASPLSGLGGPASSRPMYTMSSELPNQQLQAMDDMNRSDASSSSFNLSTDAEDSEYEMLKRRGGYPGVSNTSTLDTSAIETATSYTTDEDRKIFPNLPTDDEMTQATEPSLTKPPSLLMPLQTPDDEPGRIHIYPQSNETFEDLRAWTISPPSAGGALQEPPTTKSSTSRDQHFFPAGNMNNNKIMTTAAASMSAGASISSTNNKGASMSVASGSMASRNVPGAAHRNFTSPKSQVSTDTDFSAKEFGKEFADGFGLSDFAADFGNFADFSNFPSTDGAWKGEEKKMQAWEDLNEQEKQQVKNAKSPAKQQRDRSHSNPWNTSNSDSSGVMSPANISATKKAEASPRAAGFDDPFDTTVSASQASGSSSGFQENKSLSELLELARNRKNRGNRSRVRASNSSVNSAPAFTAAYLRQHHNLGRYSTGSYSANNGSSKDRLNATGDGTSVSDIIESLEATHVMKRGDNAYSHRSVGETGAVATARAAKERLREKRRRERESQGLHTNRSTEASDSDDSDHEASESWLFDEVTGALGPRGIAADLESLSGRSNRSKNSHGNKSHKSSRRKSSRKSSSRRHRSDRSVDSHGSRTSRNSRYSHRSTKSFLSQMSEQSRSVANDLLRLEMQLAMVGSQDKRDDSAGVRAASSGASLGGASRGNSNRPSSSRKAPNTSTPSNRGIQQSSTPASSSVVIRRTKITVIAPPGKLGIILANKADSKGTVVSGVRTSSVLVDRISPGDRIVAIDGEDVSRMTVSEITTIMSRKAEYERRLTVLTIPKSGSNLSPTEGVRSSPTGKGATEFEANFPSSYRR